MTFNQLVYFKAVAEFENFHRAAEHLFVSQPSLSRAIAALEKEMGVSLFEKKGRGVCLTKAGRVFLAYTERILNECDIATRKMKELTQRGGRIDVGMVFPLADRYMPHKVRKFLDRKENVNVNFSFVQNHTPELIKRIRSGEIDIGFGGYVEGENELEFYPVLNQEIVLITSKEASFINGEPLPIKILEKNPVIGYENESWMGINTKNLYNKLKIIPEIIMECPDEHSIMAFVSENFGVALIPRIDALDESKINIHPIKDMKLSHQTFMFWEHDRYRLPAVNRFIEYMKESEGVS